MLLKPLGPNMTQLVYGSNVILFSYETPVAAFTEHSKYVRTNKKYSATTTKHINKWLNGAKAELVEQETIQAMFSYYIH